MDGYTLQIPPPIEWANQLAELAERLGVLPLAADQTNVLLMIGPGDGSKYDVGALLLAFLDRLDAVAKLG